MKPNFIYTDLEMGRVNLAPCWVLTESKIKKFGHQITRPVQLGVIEQPLFPIKHHQNGIHLLVENEDCRNGSSVW